MKTVKVAAAVIRDGNRIFAVQRGYGEYKDGWEFPGGKLEPNENACDALVREIKEELNTLIRITGYLDTIEMDYPTFHLSMACYMCEVVSGSLTLLEAEDSRWLDEATLESVDWLPADLALLPKIREALQQ